MKKLLILFICLLLMLTSCKVRPIDFPDEEIAVPLTENSATESEEYEISICVSEHVDGYEAGTYIVTGNDAMELMALFSGETEDAPCDCMPTHTVKFGDKTYKAAIGDISCSHFVTENQKHIFTIDEYKKLTALFEKCIVDSNFVKAQDFPDGLQWTGEIKVTAYIKDYLISSGQWTSDSEQTKEFTLTGEDAYAIYVSINSKAFAEDQYRMPNTATLEIDGKKYGLILDEGALSISNETCSRCSLEKDDDIIKVMEKYIKKSEIPVGTIIETGNSTYDYTDGE